MGLVQRSACSWIITLFQHATSCIIHWYPNFCRPIYKGQLRLVNHWLMGIVCQRATEWWERSSFLPLTPPSSVGPTDAVRAHSGTGRAERRTTSQVWARSMRSGRALAGRTKTRRPGFGRRDPGYSRQVWFPSASNMSSEVNKIRIQ